MIETNAEAFIERAQGGRSATISSSIPAQFLEASLPYDGTAHFPSLLSSPTFAPQPPTDELLLSLPSQGHYFPTIPVSYSDTVRGSAIEETSGPNGRPPSFAAPMRLPDDPTAGMIAAPMQIAPPPSSNYFPSMPEGSEACFPLYVPGQGPPTYPGMQASFQPPPAGPGSFSAPSDGFFTAPPTGPTAMPQRTSLLGSRAAGPGLSISLESQFLTEGSTPTGPTIVSTVSTDAPRIAASDLAGNWGIGPRLAVTKRINDLFALQVAYYGIFDYTVNAVTTADNDLQLAGPISLATFDFFLADQMSVKYVKNLHNVEVNTIAVVVPALGRFVAGFRHLYWKEQLNVESTDIDSFTSNYVVTTHNRMYGTQIGWDGFVNTAAGETSLKLRGGVFMNDATMGQLLTDFDNTFPLRDTSNTADRTSYLGELGLMQSFEPYPGIDLRIGYSFLWIEGLSRAPAQVDLSFTGTSGTAITTDQSAFLHGFNLGAAFGW